MMTRFFGIALVGLSSTLFACGGPAIGKDGKPVLDPSKDSGRKSAGNYLVVLQSPLPKQSHRGVSKLRIRTRNCRDVTSSVTS